MALLQIVYAPNPIFKQVAQPVAEVNDEVRKLANDMLETMYVEEAYGLGANMVGALKQVAVVDLMEDGEKNPYVFINPRVTKKSDELQSFSESSLSFPYIAADVSRPKSITLDYLDMDGKPQTLKADGFLATVIQHELDYLEGVTFIDKFSRMKRDMLMKKMNKQMKLQPPHVHGAHCSHG